MFPTFYITKTRISCNCSKSQGFVRRTPKICEITTLDLSYVVTVKSTVEISQNFVAFSEDMKFNCPLVPKYVCQAENWNSFLRPWPILVKGLRRVMIYSTSFW